MSDEISDGFFFLQADPRLKASQLLTRDVLGNDRGNILLAMDTHGRKHLLVTNDAVAGASPRAVTADNLSLLAREHEGIGYVDLVCADERLGLVFERLCSDVVDRAGQTEVSPHQALMRALDDWQSLFESTSSQLSREDQIGLHGELVVLERLAQIDPLRALSAWTGPERAIRDYSSSKAFMEVKTTTSQDAKRVTISSLDQLDPAAGEPLFLVMVGLRPDSMGDKVQVVLDRLIDLGVPRHELERKVAQYGYRFDDSNQDASFTVRTLDVWRITSDSPGLRRSEFGLGRLTGIEKVKYTLAVEALGDPCNVEESETAMRLCVS